MLNKDDKIGGYTLLGKVGSGGYGDVWKAERRTALDVNYFALKFFRPKDDRLDLEKIAREIKVWKQLKGLPHIISVIELDRFDDYVYIVSDFADGGSLESWLRARGGKASSREEAVKITLEILTGLENLHEKGFVHRDLKPDNILIMNGKFSLADFGVSREIKTHSRATGTAGTMEYMPPEAFEKNPSVTPETDIWAVGVILQKLLTGKLPYPQDDQPSLIAAILMSEPEPMPESVPQGLREIVKKALQKSRADRFQRAREMREALQNPEIFSPARQQESIEKSTFVNEDFEKTRRLIIQPTQDWRQINTEQERQRELEKVEKQEEAESFERRDEEKSLLDDPAREKNEAENSQHQDRETEKSPAPEDEKAQQTAENKTGGRRKTLRRLVVAGLSVIIISVFWFYLVNLGFRGAIESGYTRFASVFLILGADVNAKDSYGETALHEAAKDDSTTAISWLLNKGAEINAEDSSRNTPLITASRNFNLMALKLLLERGADVDAKNSYGETALHKAASYDKPEAAKALLEKGADVNAKSRYGGQTALMIASGEGKLETIKLLVEKGANLNAKDDEGNTPLHYLSKPNATPSWCVKDANDVCQDRPAMEILKFLIEKGADVNIANNEGTTLLMNVADRYTGAMELVIQKGAYVYARNKKGQTVVDLTNERMKDASEENKKFYNNVLRILQSTGVMK